MPTCHHSSSSPHRSGGAAISLLAALLAVAAMPAAGEPVRRPSPSGLQADAPASVEEVLRIPDRGLYPEGIAIDPGTGDLFVSSIRRRLILRRDAEGRISTFLSARPDVWGVLGMRWDPDRDLLWATTAAIPQMEGFDEALRGRTALLGIDRRGRVQVRLEPESETADRLLGDVLVAPDGGVWTTDSIGGAIYRVPPGEELLQRRLDDGILASPQGLAIPRSVDRLFLADYRTGIWSLGLDGGAPRQVSGPEDAELRGIDGLYAWGDDLLAIQNGTRTRRVLLLRLVHEGDRIGRVEPLLSEHPSFAGGEPTLGAVHDGRLLLVANSLWPRFTDPTAPPPVETLPEPVVIAVDLPPASIAAE